MPDPSPRRRSIRARITATATVAVALLLLVVSVGLVIGQRVLLAEALDDALVRRGDEVADLWAAGAGAAATGDDDVGWQVVDPDDEVLGASRLLAGAAPVAPSVDRATVRTRDRAEGLAAFGDRVRILSRPVALDGATATVHVVASTDDIGEAGAALAVGLAIAVPVTVGVLAILVWSLVGRTLDPVEAIRTEVEAIGATELHRRVPEPDTGDELDRLARTMNEMLARLDRSVEAQRRFVADASHELRSPLTRMRADLEVATDDEDVATLRSRLLGDVVEQGELVDGLLFLARSDAGAAPRTGPVDLDEVVRTEVARARAVARGRPEGGPVEVIVEQLDPVELVGDDRALARAVRNLIDNAVRHATATVAVALRSSDGRGSVTVDDDGPGVAPADAEVIFERFTRLDDARSRDAGGTGLGLAIAREVADHHGGTVALHGRGRGGARFVLSLPVARDRPDRDTP